MYIEEIKIKEKIYKNKLSLESKELEILVKKEDESLQEEIIKLDKIMVKEKGSQEFKEINVNCITNREELIEQRKIYTEKVLIKFEIKN